MKKDELSTLVLNSIRDAKTIVENYEYFRQQENDGLWNDFTNAEAYLSAFSSYYQSPNRMAVEEIRSYVAQYYVPYIEVFSEQETRYMQLARRIGSVAWKGAALGVLLTLLDAGFLAHAITLGIASLSSYGYIRSMKKSRKNFLTEFMKLDEEAKSICCSELESVLNDDEARIREKLSSSCSFDKA